VSGWLPIRSTMWRTPDGYGVGAVDHPHRLARYSGITRILAYATLLLMACGRIAFGQARGGARPLRVRVGGSVAFAARDCWWLSEDAPEVDGVRSKGATYGLCSCYEVGELRAVLPPKFI